MDPCSSPDINPLWQFPFSFPFLHSQRTQGQLHPSYIGKTSVFTIYTYLSIYVYIYIYIYLVRPPKDLPFLYFVYVCIVFSTHEV